MHNPLPQEPAALFIVPGDIRRQTGGSLYNRKLAERLSERGLRLEMITVPDLPYLAGLIAGVIIAPCLLLRLARRNYDVVVEDGWAHPTTLLFNLACRLTGGVRLVIIVHQVRWRATKPPVRFIVRMVEQVALRCAHLIVAVSHFIAGEVEGLVGKSERIALGRPGSAPLPGSVWERGETEAAPLRLLFVGNCTRLKGLDHLIAALGLLGDIPLRLDVVGDVNVERQYYKRLVRQAKALGVSERITFHGAVSHDHVGNFYSRADIFAFPSLYEGFGIVLAEAMHAGLAIVATRTGAANEIVSEGENALIVPLADSVALAGALRRLATDAALREDFGRRSRQLSHSLPTWKQTCDNVCDQIEIISRTTLGMKQMTKTTPRR
ncbi:MAG: glycosyltransferase family 4 protein [Blastocatellia bacterium]